MEPAHGIGLYCEKLAVHEFSEWGGKQDCGIERFQQDVLADRSVTGCLKDGCRLGERGMFHQPRDSTSAGGFRCGSMIVHCTDRRRGLSGRGDLSQQRVGPVIQPA